MKRITIKFALRGNVFERLENSDKNQLKSVVNAFWMPKMSMCTHGNVKDYFIEYPDVIKCQASTSAETEILKEFAEAFGVDEITLPRYLPRAILYDSYGRIVEGKPFGQMIDKTEEYEILLVAEQGTSKYKSFGKDFKQVLDKLASMSKDEFKFYPDK